MKTVMRRRLLDPGHFCELCSADKDTLLEVQQLYVVWVEEDLVAKFAGCTVEDLVSHARAYGWMIDRSYNTPDLYPRMLRDTMEIEMVDGKAQIPRVRLKEKTITIVTRQMDLIEGREQEKRVNENDVESLQRIVNEAISNLMADGHTKQEVIERLGKYLPEFKQVMEMPAIEDILKERE